MDLAETYRTARHECGHALAAVMTDHTFRYVTIRPRDGRDGVTHGTNARYATGDAVITWAGLLAEGVVTEAQEDHEHLADLQRDYPTLDMARAAEKAAEIVGEYADLLDFLAARLVEKKTLTKREFLAAMAEWTRAQRMTLGV